MGVYWTSTICARPAPRARPWAVVGEDAQLLAVYEAYGAATGQTGSGATPGRLMLGYALGVVAAGCTS